MLPKMKRGTPSTRGTRRVSMPSSVRPWIPCTRACDTPFQYHHFRK